MKIIEDLEQQIENLQKQIKDQNIAHAKEIKDQNDRIAKLEKDIEQLKSRDSKLDDPITVREAFVALEKYMMLEITGSRTKTREYHGLKELFKDKSKQLECDSFLSKHNITRDHVFLIPEIKDIGNISVFTHRAHADRPLVDLAK